MTLRTLVVTGAMATLGCGGEKAPAEPRSVVVVTDSVGRIINSAEPSPDGSRILYTQVVNNGRNSVFVSDPDGSNAIQVSHGIWDSSPVWSPDGKWIAYQGEDPNFDVYVVPSDGSAPARLLSTSPAVDGPFAWSPDGSGVLVNRTAVGDEHPVLVPINGGSERRIGPVMQGNLHGVWSPNGAQFGFDLHQGGKNTVWVQDTAPGSTPRQLTTEGFENAPATSMWSPDGKQILFTSRRTGTLDIYVLDVASGQSRQLTNDIRDDQAGRFSPDGQWIVFLSDRGGQRDVWLMPSAGGNATRLTNDVTVELLPRWAADGKSVYYSTSQNAVELQLVPIAGGPARTVHAWEDYNVLSARISPDGKTVIYDTDRVGNGDIFTVPVDGGEPASFGSSPRNDNSPRYSPDGSQVALLSDRGGSFDIWLAPASGGEARNLTASPGDEGDPIWSPDGRTIAFASNRDVGGSDVWVIPATGGTPVRLTTANVRPGDLQWSPDSKFLYFTGDRAGGNGGRDFFRVAASGGRLEALGANPQIGAARLSRDGTRVAYAAFERGWAYIYVMPTSGGASTRITRDTANVYHSYASWSHGDSLLVVSPLDLSGNRDAADLWTYRLSDGAWNQLTHTPDNEAQQAYTLDGKYMLEITNLDRRQIKRVSVEGLVGGRRN
ncbi:MAG TPA: LpqB family beta-propeller domain-containing protein [Gemmatimonadaceae bacterium]